MVSLKDLVEVFERVGSTTRKKEKISLLAHFLKEAWLSNLHLGATDLESGQWVMLGKTFKRLTDELLVDGKTSKTGGRSGYVDGVCKTGAGGGGAFNDLQESPRYPGGLALRFARGKDTE